MIQVAEIELVLNLVIISRSNKINDYRAIEATNDDGKALAEQNGKAEKEGGNRKLKHNQHTLERKRELRRPRNRS